VKLILSYLQDQSYRVLHVDNFDKALSFAHEKKIALIILDKTSLDTNELEACRRLKSIYQTEDIPFIVVTRIQELESKSEVIDLGVDDFLIKPLNSQELRARIDLLLKKKIYIQSLYPCDNTDDKSSIYDKVTGLHSYNYFKHFLGLELKKSLRHNYPVSLIMIRIDSLRYGSALSAQTGADRMILKLAQIIKSNVRETDLATRFSENEVAVILSYCDNNTALGIINRIRQLFASHDTCYIETSPQLKSTLSVGVAFCPHHSQTSDELMEKAKDMLDKARKEGMNRVCVYG